MKVSKRKSLVTRLVTAGAAGLVIAIGLFAVLSHVIDVPFVTLVVARPAPDYKRNVVETPTQIRRPIDIPKPERPEVPEVSTPTETTGDTEPGGQTIDRGGVPEPHVFTREGIGGPPGRNGGFVFTWGADQDVIKVVGIPPEYPSRALVEGIEGWVRVRFTISATGSVRDAIVVAAQPRGIFDEAAMTAIARWRYNPRVIDGIAVERVGVETLVEFELTD